jgi:hypothetical protein
MMKILPSGTFAHLIWAKSDSYLESGNLYASFAGQQKLIDNSGKTFQYDNWISNYWKTTGKLLNKILL